jgi:DNA adenine methylase
MTTTRSLYTPLRYPGGKGKLSPFLKSLLKENELIDGHYVEPFAGGAGIALELLISGYAYEIHLNDIDPAVHAFWNAVKSAPEELCEKIRNTDITIKEWKKHKEVVKKGRDPYSIDLGFSFLFLNRTNRSGIINGGVIGGLDQTGTYKIDARFNKEDIISRIHKIAYFSECIHLYNMDAVKFLDEIEKKIPEKSLIYLDPPYYVKGGDLYQNFYRQEDHADLAARVRTLKHNWMVSYDNVPEIRALYHNCHNRSYSIHYSAHSSGEGSEIMFFCDNLSIPTANS